MNLRAHGSVKLQLQEFSFAPGIEKFRGRCLDSVTAGRVLRLCKANRRIERQQERLSRRHCDMKRGVVGALSPRGCGRRENLEKCVSRGICGKIGNAQKSLPALSFAQSSCPFIRDQFSGDKMAGAGGLTRDNYCGSKTCREHELAEYTYGPFGFALCVV